MSCRSALRFCVSGLGRTVLTAEPGRLHCTVSEMSPAPGAGLTDWLVRTDVAESTRGREYAVVIGAAAWAHAQVDGRPGEALARVLAAQLDLDVLVHDRNAGVAARIAVLGPQHLV